MSKNRGQKVLGIMSGTSMDGVDFVLTKITAKGITFVDQDYVKYPVKIRTALIDLAENKLDFRKGQLLHFELGKFYFSSLKKISKKKKWKFELIGLHGQTVFHNAPNATTQIGEPSFLKEFEVPVVSDFRSKILAAGGEGAPLAPIMHYEILKNKTEWAFLNLGGMSNITLCEKKGKLFATDLGPANVFIDWAAKDFLNKDFDKNGETCRKGLPDTQVVKWYLKENPFFSRKSPKSCGREEFSEKEYKKIIKKMPSHKKEDIFASLAEISLTPIFKFLKNKKVKILVVAGGGVKNEYFMKRLKIELSPAIEVTTSEVVGFPSSAIEGASFALLAYNKLHTKKVNLSYMGLNKSLSPLGRVD